MAMFDSERCPKKVVSALKKTPANMADQVAKVKKHEYDPNIGLNKGVNMPKYS